jgi:hypothetical protein
MPEHNPENLPEPIRRELEEIERCNDPQKLIEILHRYINDMGHRLRIIAAIIRRLDDLGVEVCISKPALLPWLRLIAHSQLDPDLYASYCGDLATLKVVSRLPMPDQKRIAADEPLQVMEPGGDHRMIRPSELTRKQRRQVITKDGTLRSPAEQVTYLKEQQPAAPEVTPDPAEYVRIDRKRHGILVSRPAFIHVDQLARLMSRLGGGR